LIDDTAGPQRKFIVLAHFRSGSGLLCDLLNLHPDIHCDYEILYRFQGSGMQPQFLLLFMKSLMARTDAQSYGCNIKLDQLNRVHPDPRQFMRERYDDGWKVVYLKRENVLRAAVSNFIAAHHQRYSLPKDARGALPKTHVDCGELLNLLDWYQRIADQEDDVLAGIPHLKLIYEDDLLDTDRHQQALDRVFDYLGLPTAPVRARSARTSADDLADYLDNHDEVVQFVRRTRYARFLQRK